MLRVRNDPEAWSERAREASTSWEAALWSERGQRVRFEAALHHLNLKVGDSLLDYGCGTGALSDLIPAGVAYYGYDTSAGMLQRAREERPFKSFLRSAVPSFASHVAAIGVWNLAEPEDAIEGIQMLWERTGNTLVASVHRDLLSPAELAEAFPSCLLDLSYLPNDAMVVLRKPDYVAADLARAEIRKHGWEVTDHPTGSVVWPRP